LSYRWRCCVLVERSHRLPAVQSKQRHHVTALVRIGFREREKKEESAKVATRAAFGLSFCGD